MECLEELLLFLPALLVNISFNCFATGLKSSGHDLLDQPSQAIHVVFIPITLSTVSKMFDLRRQKK